MILNFQDRVKYLYENTINPAVRDVCWAITEMSAYTPEESLATIYVARLEKLDESSLSNVDRKMIAFEKRWQYLNDLGFKNLESAMNESSIRSYPQFFYGIDSIYTQYKTSKVPAALLLESMLNALSPLQFDTIIGAATRPLYEALHDHAEEIMIMKGIYTLGNDRNRIVYGPIIESMERYLFEYNPSMRSGLIDDLTPYNSNGIVAEIIRGLNHYKSLSEDRALNFEAASNSMYSVENVYGLAQMAEDGTTYFSVGKDFYMLTESGITPLSANKINELPEQTFKIPATILGSDGIRVNENAIDVVLGGKFPINMRRVDNVWKLFMNEQETNLDSIGRYVVSAELNSRPALNDLNSLRIILENSNSLTEISFAKRIRSRYHDSINAVIFANENGTISAKIQNPSMGINEWVSGANGMQIRNKILDTLNFDIASVLEGFIDAGKEELLKIDEDQRVILNNIDILINKISEIQIKSKDILLENRTEITDIINTLEEEISNQQIMFDVLQNKKYNLLHVSESADVCNIGDRVEVEGVTGNVTSYDEITGEAIILTDDGKTLVTSIDIISVCSEAMPIAESIEPGTRVSISDSDICGSVIGVNDFTGTYTIMTDSGETLEFDASRVTSLDSQLDSITDKQEEIANSNASSVPVTEDANNTTVISSETIIELANQLEISPTSIVGTSIETSLERLKYMSNLYQEQRYIEIGNFQFMVVPLSGEGYLIIGKDSENGQSFALEANTLSAISQDSEKYGNVAPDDEAPIITA